MTKEDILNEINMLEIENFKLSIFEKSMKLLLNSAYGALGNVHFRFFDLRIASAITSNGQLCTRGVAKHVVDKYPIISIVYGDTDSIFLSCDKVLKSRFKDKEPSKEEALNFILKFSDKCITPEIDIFFNKLKDVLNMRELTIGMEPECIADDVLIRSKKNYIMNKLWDEGEFLLDNPKKKIRGIEVVRSSTPKVVREALKTAIDLIFKTKDNNTLIEFIDDFKRKFDTLGIQEISSPRSVNLMRTITKDEFGNPIKPREVQYTLTDKSLPIQVCAALNYNKTLEKLGLDNKYQLITSGTKIKFCYVKQDNIVRTHVIAFIDELPPELNDKFKLDYKSQYESTFLNPIKSIFEALNWNLIKRNSLDEFFS